MQLHRGPVAPSNHSIGKPMSSGRIRLCDVETQKRIPLMNCIDPVVDSSRSPWMGIKLEYYRVGPSAGNEAAVEGYLAALCIAGAYQTSYGAGPRHKALTVEYRPGTLFLTGPGQIPARSSTGEMEFLALELAPELVSRAANEMIGSAAFEIQRVWAGKDDQLRYIMLALHNELLSGCPSGHLFAECLALSFATAILSRHSLISSRLDRDGALPPHKLAKILEYITDNLSEDLSLATMANQLQMGPCHFARAFKESTGKSPHQFVLRRKIERSLQVIKETSTALAEIAYNLGFCSQAHFTSVFIKMLGMTPYSYRKQTRLSLPGSVLYADPAIAS
jgi:AraC family transcriptional regulator